MKSRATNRTPATIATSTRAKHAYEIAVSSGRRSPARCWPSIVPAPTACDRTPTALVEAEPAWITPPGVAPTATRESQAAAVPAAPAGDAASADAAPAETAEPGVPPLAARADVREDIFNARISAAADAYLAELRADALVRQP